MAIPRGERYELCRSVHAEANAIIAASREEMLDADLYLACTDPKTGASIGGTTSCQMCKRMVINAGIKRVIVRETATEYSIYNVEDWVTNDDSLGQKGY
jgi:dCMP deaminase